MPKSNAKQAKSHGQLRPELKPRKSVEVRKPLQTKNSAPAKRISPELEKLRDKVLAAEKKIATVVGKRPSGPPLASGVASLINYGVAKAAASKVNGEYKRRLAFEAAHRDDPVFHPAHPVMGAARKDNPMQVVALTDAAGRQVGSAVSRAASTNAAVEQRPTAVLGQAPTMRAVQIENTQPEITRHVRRDHVQADGTPVSAQFTVVRHREYVQDIVAQVAAGAPLGTPTPYRVSQVDTNPSNPNFVAWLAQFAQNYEMWFWERNDMEHKTESSTATAGRQGGVWDYNVTDTAPPNKLVFYSTNGSVVAPVWQNMGVAFRRVPGSYLNQYFTGPVPPGGDPKMYSPATYNVMTQDAILPSTSQTSVGELFTDYEVWLMEPSLENTGTASSIAASWGIQASAPDNTLTYALRDSAAGVANAVTTTVTANPANSPVVQLAPGLSTGLDASEVYRVALPNATARYLVVANLNAAFNVGIVSTGGDSDLAFFLSGLNINTTATVTIDGPDLVHSATTLAVTQPGSSIGTSSGTLGHTENGLFTPISTGLTVAGVVSVVAGSSVSANAFVGFCIAFRKGNGTSGGKTSGISATTLNTYITLTQLPRALFGYSALSSAPRGDMPWTRRGELVLAKRAAAALAGADMGEVKTAPQFAPAATALVAASGASGRNTNARQNAGGNLANSAGWSIVTGPTSRMANG